MSARNNLLIAEFNTRRNEDAFAALVQQHVNLVFATALRQVGDRGTVEEITQNVFVALAQSSGKLGSHPTIAGWLYRTTLNKSRERLRSELRRHHREQVAINLELAKTEGESVWSSLVPLLDEALLDLRESDRLAVIMHFMEGQTFREVGSALGVNKDAARKRVNRCLDQLTDFFRRRGFVVPALAAGAPLFALSSHAAPVGLAASVTTASLAAAHSATSTSTLTLIKGALKLMAWTKMKTAIVVGVAAILAIGTTMITVKTVEHFTSSRLENYFTHFDSDYLKTAPATLVFRPSHYANQGDYIIAGRDLNANGKLMRRGCTFTEILSTAYGVGPEQMILPENSPGGRFDLLLTVRNDPLQALQAEIRKQFGLVGHIETRDADVLVLKRSDFNAPGLKADIHYGDAAKIWTERGNQTSSRKWLSRGGGPKIWMQRGNLKLVGYKMSDPDGYDIAHVISSLFNLPVIDKTGLTGNFDINLKWDDGPEMQPDNLENLKQALRDQLGLELVPSREPVEMLVVEKAKK